MTFNIGDPVEFLFLDKILIGSFRGWDDQPAGRFAVVVVKNESQMWHVTEKDIIVKTGN